MKRCELQRPSLIDFSDWLKDQADVYDDFSSRRSYKLQSQRVERFKAKLPTNSSGYWRTQRHATLTSSVSSQSRPLLPMCVMSDGRHKLCNCPKFQKLSVEDRLKEVRKNNLCFGCFGGRHCQNDCRWNKQCGTNGCRKYHHAMQHKVWNGTTENSDGYATSYQAPQNTVTSEYSKTSHLTNRSSVLLQVVPPTLHGQKGHLNTYGMLDTGSTCSLILSDVANKLGLDGPLEGIILNGIQKTSQLFAKRVNLQVSPANNFGVRYDVNGALTVDCLNVPEKKVDLNDLKSKFIHLSDLELPMVDGSQVTVLIGSDCC